jgi:hypothetical protein
MPISRVFFCIFLGVPSEGAFQIKKVSYETWGNTVTAHGAPYGQKACIQWGAAWLPKQNLHIIFNTFYPQKASSLKQADRRDMFKKASKCVCSLTIVVCPNPLSPAPSASSAMKTPENTEEDPEPADEGDASD